LHVINFRAVPKQQFTSNLVSYDKWLSDVGITPTTGWRWRKRGMIRTVNIYGRLYVSRQQIADFELRAAAGELARENKIPARTGHATRGRRSEPNALSSIKWALVAKN
jgi:hypothetical protein